MFGFRKRPVVGQYDKEKQQAVIRASICTGEQVAGFRDREDGTFHEIMLLQNDGDKALFMKQYGVLEEDITKEY